MPPELGLKSAFVRSCENGELRLISAGNKESGWPRHRAQLLIKDSKAGAYRRGASCAQSSQTQSWEENSINQKAWTTCPQTGCWGVNNMPSDGMRRSEQHVFRQDPEEWTTGLNRPKITKYFGQMFRSLFSGKALSQKQIKMLRKKCELPKDIIQIK